jgi:hypothetical protein
MCDPIFAHFWNKLAIKLFLKLFWSMLSRFKTSFPALERPFPVLEHPFPVLERLKMLKLLKKY